MGWKCQHNLGMTPTWDVRCQRVISQLQFSMGCFISTCSVCFSLISTLNPKTSTHICLVAAGAPARSVASAWPRQRRHSAAAAPRRRRADATSGTAFPKTRCKGPKLEAFFHRGLAIPFEDLCEKGRRLFTSKLLPIHGCCRPGHAQSQAHSFAVAQLLDSHSRSESFSKES